MDYKRNTRIICLCLCGVKKFLLRKKEFGKIPVYEIALALLLFSLKNS